MQENCEKKQIGEGKILKKMENATFSGQKLNLSNPNNRNNQRYEPRIESLEMDEGGQVGGARIGRNRHEMPG